MCQPRGKISGLLCLCHGESCAGGQLCYLPRESPWVKNWQEKLIGVPMKITDGQGAHLGAVLIGQVTPNLQRHKQATVSKMPPLQLKMQVHLT